MAVKTEREREFTALTLDFQNGDSQPSWILKFPQCLSKIQICIYFYVSMQNLVKFGWSVAELLCLRHRPGIRVSPFFQPWSLHKSKGLDGSREKLWPDVRCQMSLLMPLLTHSARLEPMFAQWKSGILTSEPWLLLNLYMV